MTASAASDAAPGTEPVAASGAADVTAQAATAAAALQEQVRALTSALRGVLARVEGSPAPPAPPLASPDAAGLATLAAPAPAAAAPSAPASLNTSDAGAAGLTAVPAAAGRGDAVDPAIARGPAVAAADDARGFERPPGEADGVAVRFAGSASAGIEAGMAAPASGADTGGTGRDHDPAERRPGSRGDEGLASVSPSAPQPGTSPSDTVARAEAPARPAAPIEQVAQRIAQLRRDGRQEISLQLDPPELGTVHIEAVLQRGHLTLDIRTEMGRGRELLEQGMPQLRQALADLGMSSGQVTVNLGLDSSGRESPWRDAAPFGQPAVAAAPPSTPRPPAPAGWREPASRGFDRWV
jgi:flagellar hook-length control protein FliK